MTARLTSVMQVSALVRRVSAEGGNAAVLVKGDATAGTILLICAEKGVVQSLRERVLDASGHYVWTAVAIAGDESAYIARRRQTDPDLWVIELDIPDAERFVAPSG